LLNLVAVLFGSALARLFPMWVVGTAVAVLFAGFGLGALFSKEEESGSGKSIGKGKSVKNVFVMTFLMIFLAEFGDKTQLGVAGLAAALPLAPVWVGGTLALAMTSLLGVWFGQTFLRRIPLYWLHRLSGVLFLSFAVYAVWRLLPEDMFT